MISPDSSTSLRLQHLLISPQRANTHLPIQNLGYRPASFGLSYQGVRKIKEAFCDNLGFHCINKFVSWKSLDLTMQGSTS